MLRKPAAGGGKGKGDKSKFSVDMDMLEEEMEGGVMEAGQQAEIRAKKRILETAVKKSKEGSGTLPQDIVQQYDAAMSMSTGRASTLRKIALQAVTKVDGENKYRLTINKPFFEEWREKNKKDYGIRRDLADTYTFAKKAAGGHKELMDAVASGEMKEVVDPDTGAKYYKRSQIEVGRETSSLHQTRIGGSTRITKDMAIEAAEQLKEIGYMLVESPAAMKAIEDGAIPDNWQPTINKALTAAESTIANGMKCANSLVDTKLPEAKYEHKKGLVKVR